MFQAIKNVTILAPITMKSIRKTSKRGAEKTQRGGRL